MIIRKSRPEDLNKILTLYEEAREFMRQNGNPNQWGNQYPPISLVTEDIERERSYVCCDNEEIVGVFLYEMGPDETYEVIYEGDWLNKDQYAVVHRITSSSTTRGVASFCLEWCFEQFPNIRIDTHRDNIPMQRMLKKNGFQECGIIHLLDGAERIAFQKVAQ
jgi:RimJ/RimL family protein N-acetyltransferase